MSQHMIDALLAERARHERAGRFDRVRLVDEQLDAYGYERPKPAPRPRLETTVQAPPETTAEPKPADYECDTCGRTFTTPAALGSHQRSHKPNPKPDDSNG